MEIKDNLCDVCLGEDRIMSAVCYEVATVKNNHYPYGYIGSFLCQDHKPLSERNEYWVIVDLKDEAVIEI